MMWKTVNADGETIDSELTLEDAKDLVAYEAKEGRELFVCPMTLAELAPQAEYTRLPTLWFDHGTIEYKVWALGYGEFLSYKKGKIAYGPQIVTWRSDCDEWDVHEVNSPRFWQWIHRMLSRVKLLGEPDPDAAHPFRESLLGLVEPPTRSLAPNRHGG